MSQLLLEGRHLAMVNDILQRIVPGKVVWAFGSRATGRLLKPFSDLDLAFDKRLSSQERVDLLEAFEESLLPIKVDLVELPDVSSEFRDRIQGDFVVVQGAKAVVG